MADLATGPDSWRIRYTRPDLGPLAEACAVNMRDAGATVAPPEYEAPSQATLGSPEIIVTILAATVAKALVAAGLKALEQALENEIDKRGESKAQIILVGTNGPPQRFPISLRNLSKDALRQFISRIVKVVDSL